MPTSTPGLADASAAFVPAATNNTPPRMRALDLGPAALTDVELLQALLERNLRPDAAAAKAHTLLAQLGGIQAVVHASLDILTPIVGRPAALDLVLSRDFALRGDRAALNDRCLLSSWSATVAFLKTALAGATRESFHALFLDHKNRLIAHEVLGVGTIGAAPVYPREVVRRALELNASALLIAHPHPSGCADPSRADIEMTRKLADALKMIDVTLHDHIVVGCGQTFSFKAKGFL